MTKNPLVSIIIPTYNRAHLIGETLDSIMNQTYTNWECIIVDDGSMDNTQDIIQCYCKKDKRFQYHHRPKDRPKGGNACRNYGFEKSKGKYVNWFDSDDLMHSNKLLVQVKALEISNFNFSVCQTIIFEKTIENIIGLRCDIIFSNTIFYDYLTQKIVWLTQSPLWKRSFLKTLSYLFDEDLQAAQEWEFHCRVLLSCKDYHVADEVLVYIRQHKNSITYNSDEKNRIWNYILARKKIYENNRKLLDGKSLNYLKDYFVNNFKNFVRDKKLNESIKYFNLFILLNKDITIESKFFCFISIFSYTIFNRGDMFLCKI
ncbi:glycosyltransferase family 2 protein [Yeosuana marina]|uniref:glycosyltransferase family 2 protein n=1 Tax=Yeosuana marina TaxID=1565536 RepID=UPI001F0EDC16|nr:glycosyltransferase family 2 protein [Yeosuana marina]